MSYNLSILTDASREGMAGLILSFNILSNGLMAVVFMFVIVLIIFISGMSLGYKIEKSSTAALFIGLLISILFRLWVDDYGNAMLGSIWVVTMSILFGISLIVTIATRETQ